MHRALYSDLIGGRHPDLELARFKHQRVAKWDERVRVFGGLRTAEGALPCVSSTSGCAMVRHRRRQGVRHCAASGAVCCYHGPRNDCRCKNRALFALYLASGVLGQTLHYRGGDSDTRGRHCCSRSDFLVLYVTQTCTHAHLTSPPFTHTRAGYSCSPRTCLSCDVPLP